MELHIFFFLFSLVLENDEQCIAHCHTADTTTTNVDDDAFEPSEWCGNKQITPNWVWHADHRVEFEIEMEIHVDPPQH